MNTTSGKTATNASQPSDALQKSDEVIGYVQKWTCTFKEAPCVYTFDMELTSAIARCNVDGWRKVGEPFPVGDIRAIRQAFADYEWSEGCSCCRDHDAHSDAKERLAALLGVPQHNGGFDFSIFRTE